MIVYATTDDYATFLGDETATASPRTLARASNLVRNYTRLWTYTTDETGAPADPALAAAFTEATCAQVAYWTETGDTGLGQAGWAKASIGGASYEAGTAGEGTGGHVLASEARAILDTTPHTVQVSVHG